MRRGVDAQEAHRGHGQPSFALRLRPGQHLAEVSPSHPAAPLMANVL